ncbi:MULTISPECIES: type II toxin-antitoxin system HicB family antitoxin [unclassified Pandoraea]|uniref:type II toxin-antitoxin system HicB family antitoxin n=1 Tax=unclassified Pandoraea TaxID=2624094 RepID=UPI000B40655F|nr:MULTISPECIES: type II toxin-antitoxin system HicB family antitoxin [unclassified Pandoraea]
MKYPATFEPDHEAGGFVVTFRDIPEAITQGDTEEEAMQMAADALLTSMDFYFDDKRPVPSPSKALKSERLISLPASVSAKILLLNEMLAQKIQPIELARRLNTTKQEVNRLIDLSHTTKIDRIEEALASLGRDLELAVT